MTFLLQVRDVDLITKKHHINPNWGTLYEIFDFKHIWAMKVKKKKKRLKNCFRSKENKEKYNKCKL